jgi:hypothetical protein
MCSYSWLEQVLQLIRPVLSYAERSALGVEPPLSVARAGSSGIGGYLAVRARPGERPLTTEGV